MTTAGTAHDFERVTTPTLIIDRELPAFDVVITESIVVDGDVGTTYEAARALDFLRVRTPLLAAAFWVRSLPERIGGRRASAPARLVLAEGDALPGWLLLGEEQGVEVAFGAVGKFWQGTIEWRDVALADFRDFDEPGFGKIACDFRVAACGDGRTLLTYECRTATTSSDARTRFARYWWLVRPFVGHIMRATLRTIRRDVETSSS
jgi:hypothetical protein